MDVCILFILVFVFSYGCLYFVHMVFVFCSYGVCLLFIRVFCILFIWVFVFCSYRCLYFHMDVCILFISVFVFSYGCLYFVHMVFVFCSYGCLYIVHMGVCINISVCILFILLFVFCLYVWFLWNINFFTMLMTCCLDSKQYIY